MTEVMADNSTIKRHDIKSLLCGENRDFLVRNNGDQVKVRDLEGKVIGLYFSGSWGDRCDLFTSKLIEAYDELSQNHSNFEVVFVTADWFEEEEGSFCRCFSRMPWIAVPFAEFATQEHLVKLFAINLSEIPNLVVLDKNGEVANAEGVLAVRKYGSEAYPFTQERIDLINTNLEDAKRNQTLRSILVSSSRDFLISNNGNKVPVSDLEGKIVGLYFSDFSASSNRFNSKLVKMYEKLKDRGENFEVVLVPLDDDESSFQLRFATVPWLAIPFKDKSCGRLGRYFELEDVPMLVVIGFDGKTLVPNAVELVEKHGDEVYPFSLQKMEELAEKEKARMESQNLESLLVSWDGDYVIGNGDVEIPVSNLVGKNILLYFSAHGIGGRFLPELIKAYEKIKAKETNFEVIFLSHDGDQAAFDNSLSSMPWLAVPFGDSRETLLSKMLNIEGHPALRAIGATGRVDATEMFKAHGAEAYPFDEERLKELEAAADEAAKRWPERLLHKEHVLVRTKHTKRSRRMGVLYGCDGCGEDGYVWAFCCEACKFTMHPKCALEEEDPKKEGYVGDAEVYYCGDGWTFYRDKCYFKCPVKEDELSLCDGVEEHRRMLDLPLNWSMRAIGPTGRAIPVDIARACWRKVPEAGAKDRVRHPLHKVYACGEIGDGWSFYCKDCIYKQLTLSEDPEEDFGCVGEVCCEAEVCCCGA